MTKQTQTPAEKVKFQIEFMALMLHVGRDKEATEALAKAFQILDDMIEAEKATA